MKYRIQVTVSGDRLGAILEVAFKGAQWDPELKVEPVTQVLPGDVAGIERPTKQVAKTRRHVPNNNRQLLVEAALKTGPKRWGELRTALSAGGLSQSSLNSLISKWQKEGKIARSPDGLWSLNDAQAAHAG